MTPVGKTFPRVFLLLLLLVMLKGFGATHTKHHRDTRTPLSEPFFDENPATSTSERTGGSKEVPTQHMLIDPSRSLSLGVNTLTTTRCCRQLYTFHPTQVDRERERERDQAHVHTDVLEQAA